jgi:rhamnosyltransferase
MAYSFKIAGVVVLYQPTAAVVSNIQTYLWIVDNSEVPQPEIIQQITAITKAEYLALPENPGLARALNVGARKALAIGADFLLTMDQDSQATPDMLPKMLQYLATQDLSRLGILTPYHLTPSGIVPDQARPYNEVQSAMTSGNLLNLSAYLNVGPYLEDLFLDYVDNEYYLRLNLHGYKVIQLNDAFLLHNWANIYKIQFLNFNTYTLNYLPLRWYYITRNLFYVVNRYGKIFPTFCRQHLLFFFKNVIKIMLFESAKLKKLHMIFTGYRDFQKGKLGKYLPS